MKNKLCLAVKHSIAFTLAETLIVIGVIGIVSALTLPNLNSSTGEKEKAAKVQKIYQNISDAFGRAEAVYGTFTDWFVNDGNNNDIKNNRMGERVTEFMKISKNCKQEQNKGCFTGSNVLNIRGSVSSSSYDSDTSAYKIVTSDGTSMNFTTDGTDKGTITVDIDGPTKGSNTLGKDIFNFVWYGDKQELGFTPTCQNVDFAGLVSNLYNDGYCAAEWIIRYDNADYLQFTNTSGKCKNGNTVSEANPRCK
ncbi:type II secretion system protein [bacterium]|nr:type II secretion system protein [bacterium]